MGSSGHQSPMETGGPVEEVHGLLGQVSGGAPHNSN